MKAVFASSDRHTIHPFKIFVVEDRAKDAEETECLLEGIAHEQIYEIEFFPEEPGLEFVIDKVDEDTSVLKTVNGTLDVGSKVIVHLKMVV